MLRFYFVLMIGVLTTSITYAQSSPNSAKSFDPALELEAQQRLEATKAQRLELEKTASTKPLDGGQSISDKKAIFIGQIDQSIRQDNSVLRNLKAEARRKLIEQIKWKNVIRSKIGEVPNDQLKMLLVDLNKQISKYKIVLKDFQKSPPTNPDAPFMSPKSAAEVLIKYFVNKGRFSNPSFLGYGIVNGNGFFPFEKGYEPTPEMMNRNGEAECGFQVLCVTGGGLLRLIQVSVKTSTEGDGKWSPMMLEAGKEMTLPPNEVRQAFITASAPAREPAKPALCFDNTKLFVGSVSTPRDYLFIFDAD